MRNATKWNGSHHKCNICWWWEHWTLLKMNLLLNKALYVYCIHTYIYAIFQKWKKSRLNGDIMNYFLNTYRFEPVPFWKWICVMKIHTEFLFLKKNQTKHIEYRIVGQFGKNICLLNVTNLKNISVAEIGLNMIFDNGWTHEMNLTIYICIRDSSLNIIDTK